jgi:hypothetical protein
MLEELKYILLDDQKIRKDVGITLDLLLLQDRRSLY